jgi:hypothetical protein
MGIFVPMEKNEILADVRNSGIHSLGSIKDRLHPRSVHLCL